MTKILDPHEFGSLLSDIWDEHDNLIDENGYPVEPFLDLIRSAPHECFFILWRNIIGCWWAQNYDVKNNDGRSETSDKVFLHASTGGWSGNESLISAMQDNVIFWHLHWVQSRRGGHYVFDITKHYYSLIPFLDEVHRKPQQTNP